MKGTSHKPVAHKQSRAVKAKKVQKKKVHNHQIAGMTTTTKSSTSSAKTATAPITTTAKQLFHNTAATTTAPNTASFVKPVAIPAFLKKHAITSPVVNFMQQRNMAAKKKTRAELFGLEPEKKAWESTSLNVFDKAALLTKYDVELAERLRTTEKIIRPKPTTPGKRHVVRIDRSELWNGRPIYKLTKTKNSTGGRGGYGRITTRGRGGGARRRLRIVDMKRSIVDMPGHVERLEYDPNRSSYIALIKYPDGRQQYVLSQQGVSSGDTIQASRREALDLVPGNAMRLRFIPVGTTISCVEIQPGHGPQLARSAGVSCELISKESSQRKNFGLLKLSSGEIRLISLDCMAVVGAMSNPLHHIRSLGKAGKSRHFGIRPVSRGLARNPVDHPHGGGGAAGRPGRPSISFSGVLAKGYKTRDRNKPAPFVYTTRHEARAKEAREKA